MDQRSLKDDLTFAELDAKVSLELEMLTKGLDDPDVDDQLVFEVMAQRCPPKKSTV